MNGRLIETLAHILIPPFVFVMAAKNVKAEILRLQQNGELTPEKFTELIDEILKTLDWITEISNELEKLESIRARK